MSKTSAAALALKRIRELTPLSVRDVAEALGKPSSSYAYYEDEFKKAFLPLDFVQSLIPIFTSHGIEADQMLRLAGVEDDIASLPAQTARRRAGVLTVDGAEYVAIGRYDAALSAGPGSLIEDNPQPRGANLFEAGWLRAVTAAAPDALAVLRVSGDSMIPTLSEGDWVLVDRSQRRPSREGIYALRVLDDCWVKRLSLNLENKRISVISDNTIYPIRNLPEDELSIIGRVIWIVARRL